MSELLRSSSSCRMLGGSRRILIWAVAVAGIVALLVIEMLVPGWRFRPDLGGNLGAGMVLVLFGSALVCEYVDSSLGMGYGTTLTPLLLLGGFEPMQIVPAVLFSEFLTGLSAGLLHHRDGNVDLIRDVRARGALLWLSSLSVVGATAAVVVAVRLPELWFKGIIGVIILSVGVVVLATYRRRLRFNRGHIMALGTVAAFNKGLSGGGYGPLVTAGQVVSGMPPKHAVAITSLAEALTCFVALSFYMMVHGEICWFLAVPLTLGALFSVPVATLTVRALPESVIRGSVGIVTCLLGMLTLARLIW